MILKQLKQLTLSATRRNARVLWLPRLYSSPAVSQPLPTSKPQKRLSRDARRAVVETFVTEYRAANAGKFPTLEATVKEVGGGYYVVRDILQELKLKPVSRVPTSTANDASSLKQDHKIESSRPISDEVSLQGDNNNLAITATSDKSEMETAPLDSKCDSDAHLPENDTLKVAEECLKNSESKEEGTLTLLGSQEPEADHLQGASVLAETHVRGESETIPPNNDTDSECDSNAHHIEGQTSMVSDECLKNSETKEEGKLTLLGSQDPKADHLEGANGLPATHVRGESETIPDSECDNNAHLIESQTSMILDECSKSSETEEEGKLDLLGSQDPKADHLEGANVLPTETHLPESQTSKVEEECFEKSETKEEEKLANLDNQEPKADHLKQAATSANVLPTETHLPDSQTSKVEQECSQNSEIKEEEVSANFLPTETRQVADKRDGEVKTGESSSAWSNIISFAKEFANFWRKG